MDKITEIKTKLDEIDPNSKEARRYRSELRNLKKNENHNKLKAEYDILKKARKEDRNIERPFRLVIGLLLLITVLIAPLFLPSLAGGGLLLAWTVLSLVILYGIVGKRIIRILLNKKKSTQNMSVNNNYH